jgi:hypothetical protein
MPSLHSSRFLSAAAPSLSLRFKHEEFCDELYTRRNTLSLTIFVGSQAAFLTAG